MVFVNFCSHVTGNGLFFYQHSSPGWCYVRCLAHVPIFTASWRLHILLGRASWNVRVLIEASSVRSVEFNINSVWKDCAGLPEVIGGAYIWLACCSNLRINHEVFQAGRELQKIIFIAEANMHRFFPPISFSGWRWHWSHWSIKMLGYNTEGLDQLIHFQTLNWYWPISFRLTWSPQAHLQVNYPTSLQRSSIGWVTPPVCGIQSNHNLEIY